MKRDSKAEAYIDCVAHLSAAVSAYESFAGNSWRSGVRDALFNTRLKDFHSALDRARKNFELFDGIKTQEDEK